jgi:3-hydroxyisobutyrate dehydrogenase-like beta-hydroxyacid dehydrogenase
LTLADKSGVGGEAVRRFFELFFPTPSFLGYSEKQLTNHFSPAGFTIAGGLKDAQHIRSLAASVDCPCPVVDIAQRNLLTARALGDDTLDWSSLVMGQRVASGLVPTSRTEALGGSKKG